MLASLSAPAFESGICPGPLSGACLDIQPFVILTGGPRTANAAGVVELTFTPLPVVGGQTVTLQAALPAGGLSIVSAPVQRFVSP